MKLHIVMNCWRSCLATNKGCPIESQHYLYILYNHTEYFTFVRLTEQGIGRFTGSAPLQSALSLEAYRKDPATCRQVKSNQCEPFDRLDYFCGNVSVGLRYTCLGNQLGQRRPECSLPVSGSIELVAREIYQEREREVDNICALTDRQEKGIPIYLYISKL